MPSLGSDPTATVDSEPSPGESEPGGSPRGDGRERLLVRAAGGLTVAPLVVSALYMLVVVGGDYFPNADIAGTEMRTRDVGVHLLWHGPYSRDGWYHPGPALFYVLAVPYRLLGSSAAALSVGALLINGVSVVGMAVLARRRGGTAAALATLVGCSLLLRALGPEFLRVPWNVYVTVLPYGLLLFLAWSMVCGDRWALPAAVFVSGFLMQTHIGYVVLAMPLLGLATAGLVVACRRADDPEGGGARFAELVRPGLLALVVGVVMWVPPVVDQARSGGGNLGRIYRWFQAGGEEAHSLIEGWRVVAAQYVVPPEWLAGEGSLTFMAEPTYVYERVLPVLLAVVLAATVLLWRRGGSSARSLIGVWAVASVVGVVATARTVGLLHAYRLHWTWVLGMVGGVLVLWAAWLLARERRGAIADRRLIAASLAAVAVLGVVNSVAAVRAGTPSTRTSQWLDELAPALRDELDDSPDVDGDVLVRSTSFGSTGYASGLALDLERHGLPGRLYSDTLGEHRHHVPGSPSRVVVDVVVDGDIPEFLNRPDRELITYAGEVPMAQLIADLAEIDRLNGQLSAGELTVEEHRRRTERLVHSAAALFLDTDASAG